MDVRCEKCQTEYELDEARLKPGGVTVKCTNCGHMFKIRKRANTDVGVPAAAVAAATAAAQQQAATSVGPRPNTTSPKQPLARQDSIFDEAPTARVGEDGPTTVDRQWLIRLENGEQKSCRELATLQQWIVSGVVSRESLISRTGKTWKRIGDIAELVQYFDIADEAKTVRAQRALAPTAPVAKSQGAKTMIGVSAAPTAAGGTILPDDEQATAHYPGRGRPPTPPPPAPIKGAVRTPPQGSPQVPAPAPSQPIPQAPRRAQTTPPPPPPKRVGQPTPAPVTGLPAAPPTAGGGPPFSPPVSAAAPAAPKPGDGGRATAMWASDTVKATSESQSQPFVGKLSAIPDEPAFAAGRVRTAMPDESSFETGRVRLEDEDELLPRRRGSKIGLVLALMVLLVGGATAAVVYAFVLRGGGNKNPAQKPPADAQQVAMVDAAVAVPPTVDAAEPPKQTPVDLAKAELAGDNEARLRTALESLAGKDEPGAQAMRALLKTAIAQTLLDRAGVAERADADKLRKEQKQLVLDAATDAQKAYKAAPEDPAANLALASVLRLQGKPARELERYVGAVKAPEWARDAALASALALARDGKLDDAKAAFAAIDNGDGKLESSGDVRARFHLALIALAQNRAADAKPLVDQVLAAQPEHAAAKALSAKLDTLVAKTDPLPPEENHGSGGKPPSGGTGGNVDTSGSYDQLLARANKLADTNCNAATTLFLKALEQKPNGVEALTGLGFCYIDAKQFSNAYSKFRSALAVSSRYEPALRGIAEMYQQQGLRDQAIEAYQRLLEVYPNNAAAKKQLERLGAGGGGTPSNGGSAAPPPPPPPQPTPPAEAGSGSG
jgi:predicted Zn finger-like uncharacterized protein